MLLRNEAFRLYNLSDLSIIPMQLKNLANELFRYSSLPSESAIYTLTRRIFESIGATFLIANTAFSMPMMTIGMFFYNLCDPPKSYHINSCSHPLTQEIIRCRLLAVMRNRFSFEKIYIVQSNQFPEIRLSNIAIGILKSLQAKEIILWNITISERELLQALENHKVYYTLEKGVGNISHYRLKLHRKISRVVLSPNHEEMLETLERLVQNQKRVSCLYFRALVPQELESRVAELTALIAPTLQCYISNEENLSCSNIAMLLEN